MQYGTSTNYGTACSQEGWKRNSYLKDGFLWDDPTHDDLGRYWMGSRRYRKEVARV
jgi:hypothetical protein